MRKHLISAVALVLIIMVIGTIVSGAYPTDISTNLDRSEWKRFAPDRGNTSLPNGRNCIQHYNGTLKVVSAGTIDDGGLWDIWISTSTDDGYHFSYEKVYENDTYDCNYPSMAVDSEEYLHIAFVIENATSGLEEVYYMNNTSGSWNKTIISAQNWSGLYPSVAVDSNDICHIVWEETNQSYSNTRIRYTNSTDLSALVTIGGEDTPTDIDIHDSYLYPTIAVNKTSIPFVGYNYFNVTTSYYMVGGGYFEAGAWTTHDDLGYNQSRNPCIAMDSDDNVYMAFNCYNTTEGANGTANITLAAYDEALTFQDGAELKNYTNASYSLYPSIAMSATGEILTGVIRKLGDVEVYMDWWVYGYDSGWSRVRAGVEENVATGATPGDEVWATINFRWSYFNNRGRDTHDGIVSSSFLDVDSTLFFISDFPELAEEEDQDNGISAGERVAEEEEAVDEEEDGVLEGFFSTTTGMIVLFGIGIGIILFFAGLYWTWFIRPQPPSVQPPTE